MNLFLRKTFPIFIIFVALLGFFPTVGVVHAQSTSTTIIPPSFDLFANPGDSLQEKIEVRNETATPQTYNLATEDFEAAGDTGSVQLVQGDPSRSYSLSTWISLNQQSITIPGHQQTNIAFSINVPNGAEPGGHYGAVSISTAAPNSTPGVADVSQGQVSLILLRVSGAVTEKASVVNFTAPKYSEYGPISLNLLVHNSGDVHIKPTGTIIITDLFGAKVAELSLDGQNVLPGANRIMTTVWGEKNPIGRYTATLVANYGETHQAMLATTSFNVFPKPLAIAVGVAVIAVILFILGVFAGRKRIAKAMKVIAQG